MPRKASPMNPNAVLSVGLQKSSALAVEPANGRCFLPSVPSAAEKLRCHLNHAPAAQSIVVTVTA